MLIIFIFIICIIILIKIIYRKRDYLIFSSIGRRNTSIQAVDLWKKDKNKAPTTPREAASVAVAIPI